MPFFLLCARAGLLYMSNQIKKDLRFFMFKSSESLFIKTGFISLKVIGLYNDKKLYVVNKG